MKKDSKHNPFSGKVKITHYECIKDGKIILSSDEQIIVDSIEEFKENAHKLVVCDEVNIKHEGIEVKELEFKK